MKTHYDELSKLNGGNYKWYSFGAPQKCDKLFENHRALDVLSINQ
jgi:hypothetical protein